jgi:drug/metabolite transporter (DMT)-like permease
VVTGIWLACASAGRFASRQGYSVTVFVFLLVLVSASLHVLWNTLVKQSEDKPSFAWLTTLVATLALAPLFIISRLVRPGPLGPPVWGWAALSGLFEALYVVLLFGAYGRADLSVVYPLSRGVAPVVTLMLGGRLLGDWVSPLEGAAVFAIVSGVTGVSLSFRDPMKSRLVRSGILFSIATGWMIASYHLVDRRAMSLAAPPNPLEYLFLVQLFMSTLVTIWFGFCLRQGRELFIEWRTNRLGVVVVGICIPAAYFLIILALRYGNVTYVTAARNIGIVLSTFVGLLFLKEQASWGRLLGSLLILAGVVGLVLAPN